MFVLEHLESEISRWLHIEYMHASQIVGKDRFMFINFKRSIDGINLVEAFMSNIFRLEYKYWSIRLYFYASRRLKSRV
jgi:ribosome biogenesis SPOUT family RNA methylase Rps3